MGALLFTVTLFGGWAAVGYAVLRLLRPGPALPNLLLAPAVGVAVTVLPVFLLSRAGIPVGRFAPWSVIPLLGVALVGIWRGWRSTPWPRYAPFGGILLAALFLTGRPMLEFGFDWLSYCNEDMGNYCLRAQRLQDHGWGEFPPEDVLKQGRDYSQFYYFMDVPGMTRVGADLLLAWAASLAGLTAHQAFMPLILAFHLSLLSTAAGLVCPSDDDRARALWTCGLLALSALTTLGTLYQLLGQVPGLALLIASLAVLSRPTAGMGVGAALRHGALGGALTAALMVIYPEVLPFLGLAVVILQAVAVMRGAAAARPLLAGVGCVLGTIALLVNGYLIDIYVWLSGQATHGAAHKELLAQIFPYYLVPTGLADLWGFLAIGGLPPAEPWLTTILLLGGGLLAVSAAVAVVWAWRGDAAAVMTVIMLAVGLALFRVPDGFGLFKLAMFIQPFLLATVVAVGLGLRGRRIVRLALLAPLGLAGIGVQAYYVEVSRGHVLASFALLPDASTDRVNTRFRRALAAVPAKHLVLDSPNLTLLKMQVLYTRGVPTALPNYYLFVPARDDDLFVHARFLSAEIAGYTRRVVGGYTQGQQVYPFRLYDAKDPSAVNRFVFATNGRPVATADGTYLVESTPRQGVLNRRRFAPGERRDFVLAPWADVHDYLLFTASVRGAHYALFTDDAGDRAAFYALENDLGFPGGTCSACGRHALFEVVNPTPAARLTVCLSTTYMADGENRLPPAAAVGAGRAPFPLIGRGSARVFAPPVPPQVLGGRPYLAVDFGTEPKRFRWRPTGAMCWYGAAIPPDPRSIIGFVRDISLASGEEYAELRPPARLARFPEDLEDPNLEYSGAYEDGWCSEAFFCRLTQPGPAAEAVVRGQVPQMRDPAFTTEATMRIDGREVARRMLAPGDFEIRAAAPAGGGVRRIDLEFSRFQRLPAGDDRPVAMKLVLVGFEAAPAALPVP